MLKNTLIKLTILNLVIFNNLNISTMEHCDSNFLNIDKNTIPKSTDDLSEAEARPLGLWNLGNTCFINSVLQSLYNIDKVTNLLLAESNNSYYKEDSLGKSYLDFLNIYLDKQKDANGQHNAFSTSNLYDKIYSVDHYKNKRGSQQDAAEFLKTLLDHILDKDVDNRDNRHNHYGFPFQSSLQTKLTELFNMTIIREKYTKGQNKKLNNDAPELLNILPINIVSSNKNQVFNSLQECLDNYFSTETVHDFILDNKIEEIDKKASIIKLPEIFIVEYKRYEKANGNNNFNKITKGVSFPINNLDLKPYVNDNIKNESCLYNLNAIIMQSGDYNSGHYIAYVKKNNQWYCCDDIKTEEIKIKDVFAIANNRADNSDKFKNFTPYILFYERKQDFSDINIINNELIDENDENDEIDENKFYQELLSHIDDNNISKFLNQNNISIDDLIKGVKQNFINIEYIVDIIKSNINNKPKNINYEQRTSTYIDTYDATNINKDTNISIINIEDIIKSNLTNNNITEKLEIQTLAEELESQALAESLINGSRLYTVNDLEYDLKNGRNALTQIELDKYKRLVSERRILQSHGIFALTIKVSKCQMRIKEVKQDIKDYLANNQSYEEEISTTNNEQQDMMDRLSFSQNIIDLYSAEIIFSILNDNKTNQILANQGIVNGQTLRNKLLEDFNDEQLDLYLMLREYQDYQNIFSLELNSNNITLDQLKDNIRDLLGL